MAMSPADLEVIPIEDEQDLRSVLTLLEDAQRSAGVPLLDEAEEQRLAAWRENGERAGGWHPLLLRRGGDAIAYAAAAGAPGDRSATGDVAVARPLRAAQEVTTIALQAVRDVAAHLDATRLQVWMRAVGPAEIDAAEAAGFALERRLAVLGRSLPSDAPAGAEALERLATAGTQVRAFVPEVDDAAVVEVLEAAYDGTDDGGWDLARFVERRNWSWFRAEDLLVAEDPDGRLAGIHWLKRRGRGAGEVYNLAVHPRAQGRGVGPALLRAGLDHLDAVGCTEVILWVDTVNERAVRLYRGQGFVTRWEDIAVGTPLQRP